MDVVAKYSDLDGASVFITGGGSGIGAAMTEGFLLQGAKVAFIQRSDASDFCDEMEKKHGKRPLFIQCDATDTTALKRAVDQGAATHDGLDVLVNNAANDQRHKTEEVDEEFWDWSLALNLRHYFFTSQAAIPHLRKAGGGSIVNFSSISYMMGADGFPAYASANAGITGLTRSLAREFGPEKIRCNALMPGWVLTERQKELWADPDSLKAHMDKQCLKEHLVPEDIVGGVLFLASGASRMMTSQALVIDGGTVMTG